MSNKNLSRHKLLDSNASRGLSNKGLKDRLLDLHAHVILTPLFRQRRAVTERILFPFGSRISSTFLSSPSDRPRVDANKRRNFLRKEIQ